MRLHKTFIGALAVALTAGELSAYAAQRGDGQDRGGRQGQSRQGDAAGETRAQNGRGNDSTDRRDQGRVARERRDDQNRGRDDRGRNDRDRNNASRNDRRRDDQWRAGNGKQSFAYRATPRFYSKKSVPRHYFGSGGNYSVYFGAGSGFRYGSPYRGRVYGYIGPVYGGRQLYGDVRLEVRPRDAAVYVDGYYAGVVDNFDGAFQSLTLAVGEHEIEVDAPGLEPRFFDVHVDPARTVSLQADLFEPRW